MAASRRPRLRVVETDAGNPIGEARPIVNVESGRRGEAIDAAEAHLVERDPGLFQRGDFVVRVAPQEIDAGPDRKVEGLRIVPVGAQHMRERFNRAVDLRHYDKRSKAWISVDCPKDFAEAYLERIGMWGLSILRGVVTAPALRPDGSIIEQPGLDAATGIYYDPRGVHFPAIPRAPDRSDALAALYRIDELLRTFDFVDERSRSVALSGILTAVCRTAMAAAPMHGMSAPVRGSGKSTLVDLPAILAMGHCAPVTSLGAKDEETEKRLGAVLMAGDPIIALDNCERPVGGDLLCQIVTQPMVSVRILGTSKRLVCSNKASLFATGNNLQFIGDMARRALTCRLDPGCERPELREFETLHPVSAALENRSALVVDVLTVARAFDMAGRPREVSPIGSFEDWSSWVRDPLIWLGRADPWDLSDAQDDPDLGKLIAVLETWARHIGNRPISGREIVELADKESGTGGPLYPELRDALVVVAGERGGVNSRRLGTWLGRVKGRLVNGKRIVPAGLLRGVARWELVGTVGE